MQTLHRIPTVTEAVAAITPPLCESYWWLTGWNFNRPVIARIGVGGHITKGPFVIVWVGDNCPAHGFREEDLRHANFILRGPIELPEELRQG